LTPDTQQSRGGAAAITHRYICASAIRRMWGRSLDLVPGTLGKPPCLGIPDTRESAPPRWVPPQIPCNAHTCRHPKKAKVCRRSPGTPQFYFPA